MQCVENGSKLVRKNFFNPLLLMNISSVSSYPARSGCAEKMQAGRPDANFSLTHKVLLLIIGPSITFAL